MRERKKRENVMCASNLEQDLLLCHNRCNRFGVFLEEGGGVLNIKEMALHHKIEIVSAHERVIFIF